MNKVIDINNLTKLNQDYCNKESNIRNNNKIYDYHQFNIIDNNRNQYLNSSNQAGLYQNNNKDGTGAFVDFDSHFRNGVNGNIMTCTRDKTDKLLQTRTFYGVPFMGKGQTILEDPDLKSKMITGEITNFGKSTNSLSGISINRFVPLIPSIKENIQNPEHIIPEYWVNGGISTRNNVKNINYMKTCGMK